MSSLRNLGKCANTRVPYCCIKFLRCNFRSSAVLMDNKGVKLYVQDFGYHRNTIVKRYTWATYYGLSLSAITFGAIVQSIQLPDRCGLIKDIVLGFDTLEDYETKNTPYLGAPVGRVANRIACASFDLDGVKYILTRNFMGLHHLHGGRFGFDKVIWEDVVDGNKVIFSYLSKDCEEGYPGNVLTNITYELTKDGCFNVDFLATATKKTPVNLTQHAYFNLAGHDAGALELYQHRVVICADEVTETDRSGIPTGKFIKVLGTPRDLKTEKLLGDIDMTGNLFDDNYCVNSGGEGKLSHVASIRHERSGRAMDVFTDQPGVQFYTGNALPGYGAVPIIGKGGAKYSRHCGFCLETQKYADAVHHSHFPSIILVPGQVYKHKAVYKFRIEC